MQNIDILIDLLNKQEWLNKRGYKDKLINKLKIFHFIGLYEGTKNSSCSNSYSLFNKCAIITDGLSYTTSFYTTDIRYANYVILIEKFENGPSTLKLYTDKDKIINEHVFLDLISKINNVLLKEINNEQ